METELRATKEKSGPGHFMAEIACLVRIGPGGQYERRVCWWSVVFAVSTDFPDWELGLNFVSASRLCVSPSNYRPKSEGQLPYTTSESTNQDNFAADTGMSGKVSIESVQWRRVEPRAV